MNKVRSGGFKKQCEAMKSFMKEVMGMRRVRHPHCVDLLASWTEAESVGLICSPVADMDLASYLDMDLSMLQLGVLRNSVGCITSALAYLHGLNIRHEDLKPNNILIHRNNVLLTDFGFCFDFSDSGISTTTGTPTHSTFRYSAPEVHAYEDRNRLTDIWGLGRTLMEIVSYLRGHKLSALRKFWRSKGSLCDSFAWNEQATKEWVSKLIDTSATTQHGADRRESWLVSFIHHTLLSTDRLLRPTAQQVLDRLQDLDFIYPVDDMQCWVAKCCTSKTHRSSQFTELSTFNGAVPQWPILNLLASDKHLAFLLFTEHLEVFAQSEGLAFLEKVERSGAQGLGRLLSSEDDRRVLKDAVHSILTSRTSKNLEVDFDFSSCLAQALSTISIQSLKDVVFSVKFLNIFVEETDKIPRVRTVQLSHHSICLRHQSGLVYIPFILMTFDPEEGEMKRRDVVNPKHDPEVHTDELEYGYEPPTLCHLFRENRDIWTDGLGVGAVFGASTRKESYLMFQGLMQERQRKFLKRSNRGRTIKEGFYTTDCFRCFEHGLKCEGPLAGICKHCQDASAHCLFDPEAVNRGGTMRKYIDQRGHAEDMIVARWAS